ncbi:transglutaminase domain-containing protein [Roseateles sp. BYS78W]|uniref:Transglutaminase domain-containing protein n=1 Tax=Pelomonas candidula TaxID=3299025 RepID=A0ABW7HC51_9BURK
MSAPFFVTGRKHRPMLNGIGRILIGVLVFNALSPLSVLAQDKPVASPAAQRQLQQLAALNQKVEQAKAERARSPAERLTYDFQQAQDLVRTLHADQRARAPRKPGEREMEVRAVGPDIRIQAERSDLDKLSDERRADGEARLREHLQVLSRSRASVRADFDGTRRELLAKGVPGEILARHDAAVRDFEQRAEQFERASRVWMDGDEAARASALADLDDFFKRFPASRPAVPINPKQLPWRSPEPTTRQPADTKTAWFQNLWGQPKVMLAAAGNIGPINFDVMPEPGQAPTEADLAQTPETQLTPAITAKAAELGNNPLAIHNWVRNNLDWLPSWGAVQSADDTLAKKRGNAHDIASLEIALLRASKIPARYQYGTIEVDSDKLQNWVGGVNKIEAAQQLLGQGGIANRGLVQGGRVAKVRMEHVWVQAYVNWLPARGAKQGTAGQHVNPNGAHNAWVPLDASYKQYTSVGGMDLSGSAVPLAARTLVDSLLTGAEVSAQQGWVRNANLLALQTQLDDYQGRIKAYVDGQKSSATVADVIGARVIPQDVSQILAGTLPYAVVQSGQQTAQVPASFQHQFRIQLFLAQDGLGDESSAVLSYQELTSRLAGKRFTLTYVPATQADADLMSSYLPRPHADGSPIQPGEYPTSFPAYLIRLKPQILLDGQIVAQGSQAVTMGTDLVSTAGFTSLSNMGTWDESRAESHAAGQATAIGLSLQGIGAAQLDGVKSRLVAVEAQLAGGTFNGLTGEQVAGDMLSAAIWSWFAAVETRGRLFQTQANILEKPGLSYGFFHAVANPIYSWGVVRQVRFSGVNIDVPHERVVSVSRNADTAEWIRFNRVRGQSMSALEHEIPQRFFSDPAQCNRPGSMAPKPGLPDCLEGVSAVKALSVAAQAGQKVFTITPAVYQANPGIVASQLWRHSANTQSKVQSYLDAGYEVSVHEAPISLGGWTVAGLIALDVQTGAGAYLIEGGSNGGVFAAAGIIVVGMYLLSAGIGAPILICLAISFAIHMAILALSELYSEGLVDFGSGFLAGAAALSLMRALSTLLAGTALAITVPGGVVMGIILVALALLSFYRVFNK